MKKRTRFLIFVLIFVLKINILNAADTRIITGIDGRKIVVPSSPERIAIYFLPVCEKIIMLGKASRIVLLPSEVSPWACKFYPELKNIPINPSGMVQDVERLLKLKVDLVLYPHYNHNIIKISQAGIAAVCPFNDSIKPSTINEYIAQFKKEISFAGEIVGPDSRIRIETYYKYLDTMIARINAITSKIPEANKPKIYYGRMTNIYTTQGDKTIMRWYTELAGGIYLPKEIKKQYWPVINPEQLVAWDPDIILLGMHGSFHSLENNSGLKALRAFESGKIYRIPIGISYWDMGSSETALLPLFLGKKFHPDLFKDWDIIQEMKKFYSEIYKVTLTGSDAERILNGLAPI